MKRKQQAALSSDSQNRGQSLEKRPGGSLPYRQLTNGLHFTKVKCLSHNANANAFSLYEIIHRINPIASIHFNYCMDPAFIIREYPKRCRDTPITLVVGQQQAAALREACEPLSNVEVESASIPFPYGTHHLKLSLFESEEALHIMISTANLIEDDYDLKTQCFYYFKAPFKCTDLEDSNELKDSGCDNPFRLELIDYLEGAYANKPFIGYWLDRLRDKDTDFSANLDHIVATRPGRFTGRAINDCGHMRLRQLLRQKFAAEELRQQKVKLAQFSSIGSLGANPQSWLCDEFLRSLNGGETQNMNQNNLRLIYPSSENVRSSFEGYAAGGSLPYSSQTNAKQTYLQNFLFQWKSDRYERTRAMPHVKSYTALNEVDSPAWLLITSANLSQAAWGRLEKNGTQLFCRSYELGVLICSKDHLEFDVCDALPYDLPLVKYAKEDRPFTWDSKYKNPDHNGRFGTVDYQ